MDTARQAFYHIYNRQELSDVVNDILGQLDFHPLSITLLAIVAHHNKWDTDRLHREWERRRTELLHAQHDTSLASTGEPSLASPMFPELSPDTRRLLEVVAFFPRGVDKENPEGAFPVIPNR